MLWHWLALVFTLVHAEEKEASKTNCPVSSKWSNILNIVPLPNANIITQNGTYDVTCKDSGETFINEVYGINGITEEEVFTYGRIKLTCTAGKVTPDLFSITDGWCRSGCVRITPTTYIIEYPKGVNRTDEKLSPVASTKAIIKLGCGPGYVQAIGDEGKTSVFCAPYGTYNDYQINCVEGCYYPIEGEGSTIDQLQSYEVGKPPFAIGTVLQVSCKGSNPKPITCRRGEGWFGLNKLSCKKTVTSVTGSGARRMCKVDFLVVSLVIVLSRVLS